MKNGNKLICLVFVFAVIGWIYPSDNDGAIWVVNNTNLAPLVSGHGGTGERIGDNTTYWANNSPIQIFLWSHANTTGADAEIHLYINGSKVADTSGRPLGVAEQSNKTVVATIPQYANYSVEMVNFHHYEWREYPILTGEVTTNIVTSTGTGTGCTGNCSFDVISVNAINKNNTSDSYGADISLLQRLANITNDAITQTYSFMSLENGEFEISSTNTTTGNSTDIFSTPELWQINAGNAYSSQISLTHNNLQEIINGTIYNYNRTHFDVGGANVRGVNEINGVLRLNETRRNLTTNKIDVYKYPSNGTEIDIGTADTLFDTLLVSANKNTAYNLISFVNVNTTGWNYFAARAANGRYYDNNNTAYPENLTSDKIMLRFSAAGWLGDTWSGSTGIIDITADGNWNKTSTPTRIDIFTTDSTGGVTKRVSILKNGTINVPAFAGSGNGYVCYDNSGNWYKGTPGC